MDPGAGRGGRGAAGVVGAAGGDERSRDRGIEGPSRRFSADGTRRRRAIRNAPHAGRPRRLACHYPPDVGGAGAERLQDGARCGVPSRSSSSCLSCCRSGPRAQDAPPIPLPPPVTRGSMTLEEALATRRSVRAYRDRTLSLAHLGQLLWAAQGITDAEGHRTAPSAGARYPLAEHSVVLHLDGETCTSRRRRSASARRWSARSRTTASPPSLHWGAGSGRWL